MLRDIVIFHATKLKLEALKAFPKPPMVAYRQPANLRKTLCHTKLPSKNKPKRQLYVSQKCNVDGCQCCSYTSEEKQFNSSVTKKSFKSTNIYTCLTVGVIYLITCRKCKKQYVGQTGRTAKTRCYEPRLKQQEYILMRKVTLIGTLSSISYKK